MNYILPFVIVIQIFAANNAPKTKDFIESCVWGGGGSPQNCYSRNDTITVVLTQVVFKSIALRFLNLNAESSLMRNLRKSFNSDHVM